MEGVDGVDQGPVVAGVVGLEGEDFGIEVVDDFP